MYTGDFPFLPDFPDDPLYNLIANKASDFYWKKVCVETKHKQDYEDFKKLFTSMV